MDPFLGDSELTFAFQGPSQSTSHICDILFPFYPCLVEQTFEHLCRGLGFSRGSVRRRPALCPKKAAPGGDTGQPVAVCMADL